MFRIPDGYSVYRRCFRFPFQRTPIVYIPEDTVWCSYEAETMRSAYWWLSFTTIVLLASAMSFLTRGVSVRALHVENVKCHEVHGKSMATEILNSWARWIAQTSCIVVCVQCSWECCVRRWRSEKNFSVVKGRLRLLLTSMSTEIPFRDLSTDQRTFWRKGLLADIPYCLAFANSNANGEWGSSVLSDEFIFRSENDGLVIFNRTRRQRYDSVPVDLRTQWFCIHLGD
jgi:hypothetical protein